MDNVQNINNGTGTKHVPKDDIIIRQYRHPNDLEQIRRIFVSATTTGGGSPVAVVLARFSIPQAFVYSALTLAVCLALLTYFPTLSHAALPSWVTRTMILWLGLLLGLVVLVVWSYRWYQRRAVLRFFDIFIKEGLDGELMDIVGNFSLKVTESGDCVTTGPGCFWVAEVAGKISGFVGINKNMRSDPTVGDVRRLVVAPEHQGKGVAEKLMQAVARHARVHNVQGLELTTSEYNQAAQRFYRKIGYEDVGRKSYHGLLLVVLRQDLTRDAAS